MKCRQILTQDNGLGNIRWLLFFIVRKCVNQCNGPLDEGVTQDISVRLRAKVNYRFGAQVLELAGARKWLAAFEDRALSFASQDQTIALVHTFSHDKEQQAPDVPKTIVLGQYLPAFHEIRITTAHSYPNEQELNHPLQ